MALQSALRLIGDQRVPRRPRYKLHLPSPRSECHVCSRLGAQTVAWGQTPALASREATFSLFVISLPAESHAVAAAPAK